MATLERTAKVREGYDEETGEYGFVAQCPICDKKSKLIDGKIVQKCEHYARYAGGCGGTIFVFKRE